jgi:DNA-binding NarL/FixJ family response regulator
MEGRQPSMDRGRRSALVLDRHPLWLSQLARVLERSRFEVVGTTTSEARALRLLRQYQADVLVFEPEACTSPCSRFLAAARSAAPTLRAVAVSAVDDPEAIRVTLESGAWAYVVKDADPQDVAAAVRQAFSQSIHLAGSAWDRGVAAEVTAPPRPVGIGLSVLTRREREILALATEGRSNAAIARELWVTEQTVKFHLSNIYRKLGVANRTAASRWAHEHGIETAPADPTPA